MQTSNVVCGVVGGGGRGWVSVNWQKDSQFKCVSGLLSMIAVTGRLQFLSTFEMIDRYPNPRVHLNCNLQLFGKSARDNPERYCGLFWVHYSSEKERNLKQWHERLWRYACECLKKATKVGSIATVLGTVYWSYPITFRDCRAQFFPTTFLEIAVYKEHAKSRGIVCIQVKRSRAARTRFTSKDELGCLDE